MRSGHIRPVCTVCQYIVFFDPKVAAISFITQDDRVLLVKRGMNPGKGLWGLAGGFVEVGEDPRATAQREVLEETGLEVEIVTLLDLFFNPADGSAITLAFRAQVMGGDLRAGDDAEEVGWFASDNLPPLVFTSTKTLVGRWVDGALSS